MRSKRYDTDIIEGPGSYTVADGVELDVQERADQDGSLTRRSVLIEHQQTGTWRSVLTVHRDARNRGWVWLDLYPPPGMQAAPPRLARHLVEVLHGRDGLAVLEHGAVTVGVDELPQLRSVLEDPQRRGLAFVAGTPDSFPLQVWRQYVQKMVKRSIGIATTYVLDADATREVKEFWPDSHLVVGAQIRTFLPGVDFSDPLDGRRHRFLSARTIVERDTGHLNFVLGNQALRASLEAPLPRDAVRIDQLLRRDYDQALVSELAVHPVAPPAPALPPEPEAAKPSVREVEEPAVEREPLTEDPALDGGLKWILAGIVELATGTREVTATALEGLTSFVRAARQRETAQEKVRRRLEELQLEIEVQAEEIELLHKQLDDETLEKEQAEADRIDAVRRLRYYLGEVEPRYRGEAETAVFALTADDWPETFEVLLEKMKDLPFVEFTGERSVMLELDQRATGYSWAKKSWEALLALNDFGRVRAEESFTGDVHAYLGNTPPGCYGFSQNRHARTESDDVQSNPKFAKARLLKVPPNVENSGKVHMWAHFKIAQYKLVSPRIHYLDATSKDGKVYVGHIGPHLPTSQTN